MSNEILLRLSNRNKNVKFFLCDCACGRKNVWVNAANLIRGSSLSCGCYKKELAAKRWEDYRENAPVPSCHPNQPYHSKGLCEQCYITAYSLESRYGLTGNDVEAMLVAQNYKCALCLKQFDGRGPGKLHIDHCHSTGHIRGILCVKCNTALGSLGDTEEALLRVLEYLRGNVVTYRRNPDGSLGAAVWASGYTE